MCGRYVRRSDKQRIEKKCRISETLNVRWFRDRKFVLQLLGFFVLLVYTIFTGLMFIVNKKAADAAKSAADTAASQLELSERPWIKVDAEVAGPYIYDQNGGHAQFSVTVKNIGKSPAIKVWLDPELYLSSLYRADPAIERDRFCKQNTVGGASLGYTLFPDDTPHQEKWELPISNEQIRAIQADFHKITPHIHTIWQFRVDLIACVAYSPTFNPSKRYITGVVYEVRDKSSGLPVALQVNKNLSASDVKLVPPELGGTLAQ